MGASTIFLDFDTSLFHTSSRRLRRLFFRRLSDFPSSVQRCVRACDCPLAVKRCKLGLGLHPRQRRDRSLFRATFPSSRAMMSRSDSSAAFSFSVCRLVASLFDRVGDLAKLIDVVVCAALRDFHIWRRQILAYDRAAGFLLSVEAVLTQQHDLPVDAGEAVGRASSGSGPRRCRLAAHEANVATDIVAGFDVKDDPPELDLYDVAELGCPASFASVHCGSPLLRSAYPSCFEPLLINSRRMRRSWRSTRSSTRSSTRPFT